MEKDLKKNLEELKAAGLSPEREVRLRAELATAGVDHVLPPPVAKQDSPFSGFDRSVYAFNDLMVLRQADNPQYGTVGLMKSLDELLERDRQREEDGFPRKIQLGRLVKARRGAQGAVTVVVPSTVEEKFYHDPSVQPEEDEGRASGGTGDEQEGEVFGEQQARQEGEEPGAGPGQGEGEKHEIESSAYELGKTLTEQFQLPNLKEKGKKVSFTRYTYDLTDRNRGVGQILDKKATLRRIIETNSALGNIPDVADIDPSRFMIAPRDKVYRVFSQEKDYEPQAMVFFLRDYSGSMAGKVTDLVVTQHILIYSWLLYQYAGQVECRFILHDTEAKEVPDFYTYYNSRVAGGTQVAGAYQLVNEMVAKGNLANDYNIYVFHGTDGDDWDSRGQLAIPELEKMLAYVSRVGVTVAEHGFGQPGITEVARYLEDSGLLKERANLIRMDVMQEDADEPRLIEGIKRLIS
ncbi:DUF444 family protein [Geobacter sp. SVR]|uniref:DUF444 family protein n=1 Tax=Geobacter sp. SVR TaxID=2495594 RepID=UPI00143F01E2|nr:DUF444 family protein [Geobacter sp. SVR]BCS54695.1 hypothetical protein GSVR_30030 [Geobacter sp. SVR]GCF87635.1 hypothetical protein GSbR_42350 [Geobacter sp. SVR]